MAAIPLLSSSDELLGTIKCAPKYKYLGVKITTQSVNGIFKEAIKTCKAKLKTHAGIILGMTNHDFDPIVNGLNLWSSIAISAAPYGAEVIRFSQEDIKDLENIQASFLAHLLGQKVSVSHAALRNETGVQSITQIITKMKLMYWYHLSKYPRDSWLGAAFAECFPENSKGHNDLDQSAWKSSYESEIRQLKTSIGLPQSKTFAKKSIAKKTIKKLSHTHFIQIDKKSIEIQKEHSLRSYTESPFTGKPLRYLSTIKDRKILTQFRLGNAGLGNRMKDPIKICPLCRKAPNTESHLVFDCPRVADTRQRLGQSIQFTEYLKSTSTIPHSDLKLQHFLQTTQTTPEILQGRAEFLKFLLEFYFEELAKTNVDPKTNAPISILAEKCPLCNFTSQTTKGVKIHTSKVHKTSK